MFQNLMGEMQEQYGEADLGGTAHFPAITQALEGFSGHRNLARASTQIVYDATMLVGGRSSSSSPPPPPHNISVCVPPPPPNALEMMESGNSNNIGGGSSGRWHRQETLTLLEIRSRLHHSFKDANQKGPLWDEVSRIMEEEHGYQRSSKKCREKFENLYKYYKKTKDGKAGRQDGRHYRFFRQLEALYGESTSTANQTDLLSSSSLTHLVHNYDLHDHPYNRTTNDCISNQANQQANLQHQKHPAAAPDESMISFSISSSSENHNHGHDLSAIAFPFIKEKKKLGRINGSSGSSRKNWKAKMVGFVDSHVRKVMETQEAWMERVLKTFEHKEQERMVREEEWRREEAARLDQEYNFLAKQRAWVEAHDMTIFEALQKFTRSEITLLIPKEVAGKHMEDINGIDDEIPNNINNQINGWHEPEISTLIQLRSSMETRFQESGYLDQLECLWEEIASKMACLGYDTGALRCKEMWESINMYYNKTVGLM